VLVVAADDGVMPTTREAVNHARVADVPIIVAINKIDKPNANPDLAKQQLSELELVPDDWDGDTIMVPVSAKDNIGIDDLLEAILLVAGENDIKANPNREGRGVVLEGSIESGRGAVATLLVQNGTLRQGDIVVAGTSYGRIKAMFDEFNKRLDAAEPSRPVSVMGLDRQPSAGDQFEVVKDTKTARKLVDQRELDADQPGGLVRAQTLEDLFAQFQAGEMTELALVVKVDVDGSLQPVVASLEDIEISADGPRVRIIHAEVGDITENDVNLAQSSNAIIVGFNTDADNAARKAAEAYRVEIRHYNIIYKLIEDIELALHGLLEPVYEDKVVGRAEVRAVFKIPKVGFIAGCYVLDGTIQRNAKARVRRHGEIISDKQGVSSLKRVEEDVREVRSGFECGIRLANFQDYKEGDIIEFIVSERVN